MIVAGVEVVVRVGDGHTLVIHPTRTANLGGVPWR